MSLYLNGLATGNKCFVYTHIHLSGALGAEYALKVASPGFYLSIPFLHHLDIINATMQRLGSNCPISCMQLCWLESPNSQFVCFYRKRGGGDSVEFQTDLLDSRTSWPETYIYSIIGLQFHLCSRYSRLGLKTILEKIDQYSDWF